MNSYVVNIVQTYNIAAPTMAKALKAFEAMRELKREPDQEERTIVCENDGTEESF